MAKRAAIYIRVSTDEQKNKWVSIESQKDNLLEFIEKEWYSFNEKKHCFIDWWYSWASEDRPELERMMKAAKRWEFDIILVWKIDRFFRKTLHLLEYVEYLISFWVSFRATSQDFAADTASWKMILWIFWVMAELERDMIRERTSSWKLKKAEQWYFVWWGWIPLWYDAIKDWVWTKLKVNKYEKKIINRIFDLYVNERKTIWEVATQLNIDWYKTKSVINNENRWKKSLNNWKWSASFVGKVLKNSMYIWEYYYWKTYKKYDKVTKKTIQLPSPKDKILVLNCEPILDDFSLFDKAQELLEKNRRTKNNANSHTFAWLIKCNECWRWYYWYNTHNKKSISYRCWWKMKSKLKAWEEKCKNHEVSEKFLIDTCWDKIYEIFKDPDRALEKYYEEKHKNNNLDRYIIEKNKYLEDRKKHEEWIKKLYKENALSNDDFEIKAKEEIINELKKEIVIINKNISVLDNKILSLKNKLENLNNLNQLKAYYNKKIENLTNEKKTEIIKELVEKIVIYKNWEILIVFKFQKDDDSDDWRNWLDEDKSFMRDDIDYDADFGWVNSLANWIKSFGKSLTNNLALPY